MSLFGIGRRYYRPFKNSSRLSFARKNLYLAGARYGGRFRSRNFRRRLNRKYFKGGF